MLDFTQD